MKSAPTATPVDFQIADLFLEIIESPPSGRAAILDAVRRTSSETAEELERLLRSHEAAGDFLLQPAEIPVDEAPPRGLLAGDILSERFLVEQFLGAGGFGEVYLALDQELGRRVALKTIKPESTGVPQFVEQIKEEIRAAQAVSHPNLCRLYDLHRAQLAASEIVFVTMEWISGPTLSAHLRDRALSESESLAIATQVLSGLAELHARQVIHCDLKSSNIMLDPEPGGGRRAVIMDFGLARMQTPAGQDTLTLLKSGWALGTPAYMAPEQLRGKHASIASDLHAIGVILFEMRARRLPFEGDSPLDIAMARLEREAPSVRLYNREAGKRWETTIAACLAADPRLRPRSASEVLALLEGRARRFPRRLFLRSAAAAGIASAGYLGWRLRPRDPNAGLAAAAQRSMQLGAMFLRDRNKQSLTSAVDEFSSVTRAYPNHAPAWAGLAEAYSSLLGYGYMDTREALRLATEAGKRAVDLDPRDARALTVYARNLSINVRRWLEAEPYFLRAMRSDSNDSRLLHWYANHLGRLGRFDEAIRLLERGVARYPDDLAMNSQLATEYFRAGQFARFETAAREFARLFYDKPVSRMTLARALEWNGKFDEAEREVAEAIRLGWTVQAVPQQVTLAAARGRLDTARAFAAQAESQWRTGEIEAVQMAVVYTVIGEASKAIAVLNEGFDREDSSILYAPTYRYFDGIRKTDEFVRFVRRLGLHG